MPPPRLLGPVGWTSVRRSVRPRVGRTRPSRSDRTRPTGSGRGLTNDPRVPARSAAPPVLLVGLVLLAGLGVVPTLSSTDAATGATGVAGPGGSPARWAPLSGGSLEIAEFTADPSTMVIGTVTYLNVTAVGGVPPLSYRWVDLPPGCHGYNLSSLGCSPMGVQHYVIGVVVNDSTGANANATVELTVLSGYGGPPTIHHFFADPSPVTVFSTTYLDVNATSSSTTATGALTYAFLGLPPGCASFNQTRLACVPKVAGTYHLHVTVADGFGAMAVASAFLNVTEAPTASATSGLGPTMWLIPMAIVLVAAVVLVLVVPPRRRKPVSAWAEAPNVPAPVAP